MENEIVIQFDSPNENENPNAELVKQNVCEEQKENLNDPNKLPGGDTISDNANSHVSVDNLVDDINSMNINNDSMEDGQIPASVSMGDTAAADSVEPNEGKESAVVDVTEQGHNEEPAVVDSKQENDKAELGENTFENPPNATVTPMLDAIITSTTPERPARAITPPTTLFQVKTINFAEIPTRIVLQNTNGACPLISVINALALKGTICIRNVPQIEFAELNQLIADAMFRLKPKELSNEEEENYSKSISDVIELLPSIGSGLDVNVRFTSIADFEYTAAMSLFDLLCLRVVHGWLPDAEQSELCAFLHKLSYNEAIVKYIDSSESTEAFLVQDFLTSNANQLTFYGLAQLNQSLKDGEIAVLFRNNHFSTLYKHRDELFTLCSDAGFADSSIVWETLSSVDGDNYFVNANFHNTIATEKSTEVIAEEKQIESDHNFAQQLFEEEKRGYEQERLSSAGRGPSATPSTNSPVRATAAVNTNTSGNSESSKKGFCAIM